MNKRILLIVAALLAVSLVATPLLVGARKSKAAINLVFYDLEMVSSEIKEWCGVIVSTSQWTSQILVLFPGMSQGILPMYGGTAEAFITEM